MIIFSSAKSDLSDVFQEDLNSFGHLAGEGLDPICSEDLAYEFFCDIADSFLGSPITAVARFDPTHSERSAIFRSRIRAIYRASVWGQFSLLCTGISTPNDLDVCADIIKEAFCELESEGREFNGFIEKGICIDSPMMLYNFPQRSRFDFLCFDCEKLRYLGTGIKKSIIGTTELANEISKVCRSNEKSAIAIISNDKGEAKKSVKILDELKIDKIYILREHSKA